MPKNKDIPNDPDGPGRVLEPPSAGGQSENRAERIPHSKLLRDLQLSEETPNTLVEIYQKRVLPDQTRTIQLLGKKYPARILLTLLGFEVQASYKRIQCPDMVTARYLKLFTELGCRSIRLPYDPTVTASLLPEIEACVANISRGIHALFPNDPALQKYVLRRVYAIIRGQLKKSG
jgi:hypothetical protein